MDRGDNYGTLALSFIATLSFSAKTENQVKFLNENGYTVDSQMSLFLLLASAQRYMNIERAAASSINDYETLQALNLQLSEQSKAIADHTFEISKLTQSFAAGWFNRNVTDSLPSDNQIEGFLSHSFSKLREKFRREADSQ